MTVNDKNVINCKINLQIMSNYKFLKDRNQKFVLVCIKN